MFKKTLGIFVLALLAVSVVGVVYANLCVSFTMGHVVETGTVKIGIKNTGVSDGQGMNDLVFDGRNIVRTHKDVANVTSVNIGEPKCFCNDEPFYQAVFFNITDAYPWYVAYENLTIVNCGTIPVFISSISLDAFSDPNGIANHVDFWWYVTAPNGTVYNGQTTEALAATLKGVQIDACDEVEVSLWLMFLQTTPLNSKATFAVTLTGCQWNEVLYPPND